MSFITAVFIYFLIWWVMLFTVLPLGIERHGEQGKGFDPGAPRIPHLKKKMILNTIISAVILAILVILVEIGVINWTAWFEQGF